MFVMVVEARLNKKANKTSLLDHYLCDCFVLLAPYLKRFIHSFIFHSFNHVLSACHVPHLMLDIPSFCRSSHLGFCLSSKNEVTLFT